jgi:hypothetical protein
MDSKMMNQKLMISGWFEMNLSSVLPKPISTQNLWSCHANMSGTEGREGRGGGRGGEGAREEKRGRGEDKNLRNQTRNMILLTTKPIPLALTLPAPPLPVALLLLELC